MFDAHLREAVLSSAQLFGALVDLRWPVPVVLKWLTPYFDGTGHGVSTGQSSGLHPDDLALLPAAVERVRDGETVTGRMRNRHPNGGWQWSNVTLRMVHPEAAPALALILFSPEEVEPAEAARGSHLPMTPTARP